MSEKTAIVNSLPEVYTRKKDNQPGLKASLVLEDNTTIIIYGKDDDPILTKLRQGEMVLVEKNGNFWNITSTMNEEGEFVKVERIKSTAPNTPTVQTVVDSVDVEEVKKYIRWHSKIMAYCVEQCPDNATLIYQQACQKFNL